VRFSKEVRQCCGHSTEVSYDGYCTLLTCDCICRDHCKHLQVTVPGEARRDERLSGAPLHGWCRHCRIQVDDSHIRKLRPQRHSRMAIYWLGESQTSGEELRAIAAASTRQEAEQAGTAPVQHTQLALF